MVVISFQSMEDRLVKQAFRSAEQAGRVRSSDQQARQPLPTRNGPQPAQPLVETASGEAVGQADPAVIGRDARARSGGVMTRETKIGLLVGLAFIIVIGILIADYSADSMRRPPAPMMDAMQNVLDSANNPGVRRPNGQVPKGTSAPQRMIGQDGRQSTPDIRIVPPAQNDSAVRIDGGGREGSGQLPVVQLKPQDPSGNTGESKLSANAKEIVAVEKDTVYKWAKKHMGAPTQANIDAIINANPTLKGNKPIRIGDKYKIPVETPASASRERDSATPAAAPAKPERPNATERTDRTELADRTDRSASAERSDRAERPETAERDAKLISYTTKRGDNLWRIAERQCGDGRLASKIRELNNLRGDEIHPEMTLKLPAKGT